MSEVPYQVSFAAGGVAAIQPIASGSDPAGALVTADMPAFDLTAGCRIEVGTYDLDGNPRPQDSVATVVLSIADLTSGDE